MHVSTPFYAGSWRDAQNETWLWYLQANSSINESVTEKFEHDAHGLFSNCGHNMWLNIGNKVWIRSVIANPPQATYHYQPKVGALSIIFNVYKLFQDLIECFIIRVFKIKKQSVWSTVVAQRCI